MNIEEDFIDFTCPYCKDPVSFPLQNRGSLQQCPMCYESLLVPKEPGGRGAQNTGAFLDQAIDVEASGSGRLEGPIGVSVG